MDRARGLGAARLRAFGASDGPAEARRIATRRRREDRGLGAEAHAGTRPSISRTSTTSPAIAAAATIAGLISSVRPVGLPWRPLKLRLDEEADSWRPSSLSGFMPRHIEQP